MTHMLKNATGNLRSQLERERKARAHLAEAGDTGTLLRTLLHPCSLYLMHKNMQWQMRKKLTKYN